MRHRLWSPLIVLLLALVPVAAADAQVIQFDDGEDCPGDQVRFCLKSTSDGEVILTGVTVYRGENNTGDYHELIDDANGGDDVKLKKKGKYACWCASFEPKSFKYVTGYDYTLAVSVPYPGTFSQEAPLFDGAEVAVSIDLSDPAPEPPPVGTAIYVDGGTTAFFPSAVFTHLDGTPFDGWLTYVGGLLQSVETPDPDALPVANTALPE